MMESEDRNELSQDALVRALVPDPDHLPDVIMLQGFLGRGGAEDTWRLYFTQDLDDYVDIPADKIVHSRKLPDERGTMVWVPKGLVLEHKQVRSADVQAEFLAGPITSRLGAMGAASPRGMGAEDPLGIIGIDISYLCSRLTCPSVLLPCPPIWHASYHGIGCPSGKWPC